MKLTSRFAAALLVFVLGAVGGCFLSDLAGRSGFPDQRYLLELVHDGSAEAVYVCTRTGAVLGDNFSGFDMQTKKQTTCILGVTGRPLPDGSFEARTAPFLWAGRLGLTQAVRIEAARVKRLREMR
jgi:hypothetical protein